ncbi:nucleotide exchange factor GrpE [Nonlabens arenilitoris]|uniref:Protein GrpE n=1 Tax=Nonlabens arenilitoris TaxID=1217969 RepID=A0A2S7U5Z0_9FLAO|nr:nucleotide exchange factor GrpE [Nonlabens arenilitoris]PQJ30435.1 nucleotide exchange factor GrpE [Nonlabens arenilitoris]
MAKNKKEEQELKDLEAQTVDQQEDVNDKAAVEEQEQKDPIVELEEQLQQEKDKFLRLFAEFENFKRRTAKERNELFKTAGEGVLKDMLPVIDDFDRAMIEINKSEEKNLIEGVTLISNKLRNTLKAKGLEQMEVRSGDAFNADYHEAITQIPAPSDEMKGKIIDVIEQGYKLGDKIIRYPKVVIGQ